MPFFWEGAGDSDEGIKRAICRVGIKVSWTSWYKHTVY